MFPTRVQGGAHHRCFPRVRGDVPDSCTGWRASPMFSPRARGCSDRRRSRPCGDMVFPACAGMFRVTVAGITLHHRFPRVRGDVPIQNAFVATPPMFSPRARGCSGVAPAPHPWSGVFPACTGMFLRNPGTCHAHYCFFRVRGDVPVLPHVFHAIPQFSPRARGCSGYWPSY